MSYSDYLGPQFRSTSWKGSPGREGREKLQPDDNSYEKDVVGSVKHHGTKSQGVWWEHANPGGTVRI